jgi:hypothetical protein
MQLAFDLPDDVPAPQLVVRRSGLLGRIVGAARIPLPGPGAL